MRPSAGYGATADRVAIVLSGLCAVHCVFTPLAIIVAPTLGVWLDDDEFHFLMLAVVLPLSCYALATGHRDHGSPTALGIGGLGLAVLVATATAGHWLLGDVGERWVTIGGSALVVCAHLLNVRYCRRRVAVARRLS